MLKMMQINNLLKTNNSIKISFLFIWCFYTSLYGATWYSDAIGGNPNDLTKWWSKSNGTGNHPSGFLDANDIFYLKSGHVYVTINTWNIGGTLQVYGELTIQSSNFIKGLVIYNKGIVFGNAQTSILDSSVGGLFSVNDGGKYVFNHSTPNNYKTLFAGKEMFGSISILEFQEFEKTNGAFSLCIENSSCNFGNVSWNIQSGNTAFNLNYNSRKNREISGDFNVIKTGSYGSLTWCNNNEVAKLTIQGNFIQSGGSFFLQRMSIGSDSCTLIVKKDFILHAGIFDLGVSENFNASLELEGNFTMNNGKFYRSCLHPKKEVFVEFKGVKNQIYSYLAGDFSTKNIAFLIYNGASLLLGSNICIEHILTINEGGTLITPNPFFVFGVGTCSFVHGAKLKVGHLEGIVLNEVKGAIQTSIRLFHSDIILEYNGLSFQKTGDACNFVATLILNNSVGIELSQDITITNGGSLVLLKGFHDLNGKVLTIGTSPNENKLIYEEGGLFSKNNQGFLRRWMSNVVISETSVNNYGFFPFAKSTGQIGFVKISSSDSIVGGVLSIAPIFDKDTEINCRYKDGPNSIAKVQKAFSFSIIENSLTSGNRITLEYTCGNLKSSGTLVSSYCLATYSISGVSNLGMHNLTLGNLQQPKVSRSFANAQEIMPSCTFVLGTYDSLASLKLQCNLGGVKSIGPTGEYTRLTDALVAISENGLNTSLVLELQSTYTSTAEIYPLKLNSFFCLGAANTILIRPALDAKELVISKSIDNSIFHFNQADFITIDGRPGSLGETSQLIIRNTNTLGNSILFSAGATYNSLKYLILEGSQTNISRGVIEFSSFFGTSNCYDSVINCTIQNATGKSISNAIYSKGDGILKKNEYIYIAINKLVNCISSGIFLDVFNQTWIISDNHFYQTSAFKPSSTVYGIHIVNEGSGYIIERNFIGGQTTNCNGNTYCLNTSKNHYFPIYVSITSVSNTTIIQNNTIRNILLMNTDGASDNPGVFTGIYVSSTQLSSLISVRGNTIGDTTSIPTRAIKVMSNISGALIQGILINNNGSTVVYQNFIGNFSTSNLATNGYTFYAIRTMGKGDCTIKSNKIGSKIYPKTIQIGGTETTTGICLFYGIHNTNLGELTITDNEILNCAVYGLGGSQIYGIYNISNTSNVKILRNKIAYLGNLAQNGESINALTIGIYQEAGVKNSIENNSIFSFDVKNGFFKGIYLNNTKGNTFITSNIIGSYNTNTIQIASKSKCNSFNTNVLNNHGGIVIGLNCSNCFLVTNEIRAIECVGNLDYVVGGVVVGNSSNPIVNLSDNIIENIGCSNNGLFSSEILGVYHGSTTINSSTMKKNKIRYLFNLNSYLPVIYGVYDVSNNHRIINNFISIKNSNSDSTFSNAVTLNGLKFQSGSSDNNICVYYNTIEIGGTQIHGVANSHTIFQNSSDESVTISYINNIFQNARKGGSGKHYSYYGNSTLSKQNFRNNYFTAPNPEKFAFVISDFSINEMLSFLNSNDNQSCKVSLSSFIIDKDGALNEMSTLSPTEDLHEELDCSEDINGMIGNRSIATLTNHMGCNEGPIDVFYSLSSDANSTADNVLNWNTKRDGTGVCPNDFKQEESLFVIQSEHKYQLSSTWTGNVKSSVVIDSGGVLDLHGQKLSTWKKIEIQGDGISNSGVIINSSNTPTICNIPILLKADASINSIGIGDVSFSGGFSNGEYLLTFDGVSDINVQTLPIIGLGNIQKKGEGKLYLKNQNTFSGKMIIDKGIVNVQHSDAFGGKVGGVIIQSGATIELQNGISIQDSLWIQGNTDSEMDALRNEQGENSWDGTITLNSNNVHINAKVGTLNLSGQLIHNAINLILDGEGKIITGSICGNGNVIKDGVGTLIYSKTNTYGGFTKLLKGKIELAAPQVFVKNDIELVGGVLDAKGYAIKTLGNWINNGAVYIAGKNNVTLCGINTTISGAIKHVFYDLNINTPIRLDGNVKVQNTLCLGSSLFLENYNLEMDSSATIVGYSNTSFIVTNSSGKLIRKKIGKNSNLDAQIFPVGFSQNELDYTPCRIENSGVTNDFSVRMGKERLENGYEGEPKSDHGVDRTWYLSASGEGYITNITLQWSSAREQPNFSRLNCHIGHYNGVSWDTNLEETVATKISDNVFNLSRSNIRSFSPFVVEDATALPIRLVYFNAINESQKVRLEWETASEYNNDFFSVERSQDGQIFELLFTKKGSKDSKTTLFYNAYDMSPLNGVNYYRLKQTDFDGKYTYSDLVSLNFDLGIETKLNIYPNPISGNFIQLKYTSEIKQIVQIQIFNLNGELLDEEFFWMEKGINVRTHPISFITSGIYILKLGNETIGYEILKITKE
jgi:autotransporter-associated beta strand protein